MKKKVIEGEMRGGRTYEAVIGGIVGGVEEKRGER